MRFLYDEQGELRGFTLGGETYLYAKNLQGDIIAIVNEEENVEVRYQYGPWGQTDRNDAVTGNQELAELNPFTYRGYQYDSETGLYYLQSRYYNSEWKRFLNADVYADTCTGVLGSNMFAYCDNNPVIGIDKEGTYNAQKAVNYAKKWWNGRNPLYKANSADCANFLSQCIYDGGLSKMTGVGKYGWHHYKVSTPIYKYIPYYGVSYVGSKYVFQISDAWGGTQSLRNWLSNNNHVKQKITMTQASQIGSKIKNVSLAQGSAAVFFRDVDKSNYTHSALIGIVNKKVNDVFYYAHTSNRDGNEQKVGIKKFLNDNTKKVSGKLKTGAVDIWVLK